MTDNVKIALIIGIAVVVAMFIYTNNVANINESNKAEDRRQALESHLREEALRKENGLKLSSCLADAHADYKKTWEKSCEMLDLGEDCGLSETIAEEYNKSLQIDQSRCAELYK